MTKKNTKKGPKLFSSARQDVKKVEEGVWITHPETGYRLKVRPEGCAEHNRAYLELLQEKLDEHGESHVMSDEEQKEVGAAAAAIGLIVDWDMPDNPELEYDPKLMAAALCDEELASFQMWFVKQIHRSDNFRPEQVGNE